MSEQVCALPSGAASQAAEARVGIGAGLRYGHEVTSMCPRCLRTVPGRVSSTAAGVVMRKTCPEHGAFESLIATDVASYERMRRGPRFVKPPARRHARGEGLPGRLRPLSGPRSAYLPGDRRNHVALQALIDTEGQPVPLQFAGGEPTLHPDLTEIVRDARALGFTKMEIDSNGLLLAWDARLAVELRAAGLTGVYLQFDGLAAEQYEFIRGRDLRAEKLQAIAHCRDAGLQVVLAVTVVPGVNDQEVWSLVRFAAEQRLTGINFQSVVLSGRYPQELEQSGRRFTATHFLRAIEVQSGGEMRASDLMPMSCPDPRCGLLAYIVVDRDGRFLPLNRLVGDERLRQHVADFSDWDALLRQLGCDSAGCGCGEGDALQRLAEALEGAELFSVGFHGMMDAYCFDQERARRCCVHKLTADGKLMPFCLYNIKYRRQESMAAGCAPGP